jgi:transcriptional regulator with XRE-family HTH domain/tetratricopeptide (TPR) repeat protein
VKAFRTEKAIMMSDIANKDTTGRPCGKCGRPLSRYNDADYCSGCARGATAWPGPANTAADEIGSRIRAIRLRRGLTQQVVAGLCGISAGYLSMLETGKRRVERYSLVTDLAVALQVAPAELVPRLLGGKGACSVPDDSAGLTVSWCTDPLADLAEAEALDLDMSAGRRRMLAGAAGWAAAMTLPDAAWWRAQGDSPSCPPHDRPHRIGADDVAAVRQLSVAFSKLDQLRGGGHSRKAIARYLQTDAATMLGGGFAGDQVRRDMYSAVGELVYLSAWMAFDNNEHPLARRYFLIALKLAAQAANPPLAGHILRAMAHQAIDLGMPTYGLELAEASVEGQRYLSATPRERALLGVVHARALAAAGNTRAASPALIRAEDDLRSASPGVAEPSRTFFFGEASLAHETGRTLQSCGDIQGAIRQLRHSTTTRGTEFRRTHSVTLGYLGAAQLTAGDIDQACATWREALDLIEDGGVISGRARQAVTDMHRLIKPMRGSRTAAITEIQERASAHLRAVSLASAADRD